MQEFLLTLVTIFVLFRVFGEGRSFITVSRYKQPVEPPVPGKSKKDNHDLGEYVDYEEVK